MKKKQFEEDLKTILGKIKDIPDDADVMFQYFDLKPDKASKYIIENPDVNVHMDNDLYETTDFPKDCCNLRIDIFDR